VIVILTALEVEHAAVLARMTGAEPHSHPAGTRFEVGGLAGRPDCRAALTLVGMGNSTAAALAERAIAEFEPSAILFVGVAGGLHDWLHLGDIVVATKVYAYHGGRSEDKGFLVRPRAWEPSHRALQVARSLGRSGSWRDTLRGTDPRPELHFEPIAAGEVVLDSRSSDLAQRLRDSYGDAVAVEMEGAGFAQAGHLNETIPALTIRGISDHAGGEKAVTDRVGWQSIAARNAAAFAVALAWELDVPAEARAARKRPEIPAIHNTNLAKDNAQVGQQTGVVIGDPQVVLHPRGGEE